MKKDKTVSVQSTNKESMVEQPTTILQLALETYESKFTYGCGCVGV